MSNTLSDKNEERIVLRVHFQKTRTLMAELAKNNKQNFMLPSNPKDTEYAYVQHIDSFITEDELIEHLKKVRCSEKFKDLLSDSAENTAKKLAYNDKFMQPLPYWNNKTEKGHALRKKIIEYIISSFYTALNENAKIKFPLPIVNFGEYLDINTNAKRRGEYAKGKIFINTNPDLLINKRDRVFQTAIHESVHAVHSSLIYHADISTYAKDIVIWEETMRKNAYISNDLSPKAYETQAVEEIAISTAKDFYTSFIKYHNAEKSAQPGAPAP